MSFWKVCLEKLEGELSPEQFGIWISPLQAEQRADNVVLLAPNQYVSEEVRKNYLPRIEELLLQACGEHASVSLFVGQPGKEAARRGNGKAKRAAPGRSRSKSDCGLNNDNFRFCTFVEGKSNQLARAAAWQVSENPGRTYNPLFICGASGLGKTHLMHAIGHAILERQSTANVAYVPSEGFVSEMIRALQRNTIDVFKQRYRSRDVLLIDDVQFFAGKERSQEEFFHTFNILLEGQNQVVLACDRYPREVDGIEARLKSRFSWGLTVSIEPPEFETRVAIVKSKAEQAEYALPDDVAFFIAKRFRRCVRDLEGALNKVMAYSNLTGAAVDMELCKLSLRDLLQSQDRQITLGNIQKVTAEHYKIRVADLLSKRRSRSVARPRQVAMALARELTDHSLPEIGDSFGGRDHTTVLHACRKIAELRKVESRVEEDYRNLADILSV